MDIYIQLPPELQMCVQDALEFNIIRNYIKMWEAQNEYNDSIDVFDVFDPKNRYLQFYFSKDPKDEPYYYYRNLKMV